MAAKTEQQWRESILAKLREAGAQGAPKSKTGVKRTSEVANNALSALLASGEIIRLGPEKGAYFYLSDFAPSIESIATEIGDLLEDRQPNVYTAAEVKSLLKRPEKKDLAPQVLPLMVADGDLYEFRTKNATRYLHIRSFLAHLPSRQTDEANDTSLDVRSARGAYDQAVRDSGGFPDVEIASVARLSKLPLSTLKVYLLEEALAHRVFLSEGDWSMSPDWVREGVIWHQGKHYLKVRFPHE